VAGLELTLHAWPTDNDPSAAGVVRSAAARALGHQAVIDSPPAPPSDDVSEFLRRVPGCYFFVGAAPPTGPTMHHAATFCIDESALPAGAMVLAESAVDLAMLP
jgi:metal-dependent amidase/aminoacylase/carboxypeptidase family protein